MYTLEEFSKLTGLSKDTLRQYDKILQPYRTPGGHRRYTDEHLAKLYQLNMINKDHKIQAIVYARVSTKSQLKDLKRQVEALLSFASSKGIIVDEIIQDIGSSINFSRPGLEKLIRLLLMRKPEYLIVATRDRLTRIGFEIFDQICKTTGTKLLILYDDLQADDYDPVKKTVEELVHIVHLYAMKLYGQRSYKKIKQLENEVLKNVSGFDDSNQREEETNS